MYIATLFTINKTKQKTRKGTRARINREGGGKSKRGVPYRQYIRNEGAATKCSKVVGYQLRERLRPRHAWSPVELVSNPDN